MGESSPTEPFDARQREDGESNTTVDAEPRPARSSVEESREEHPRFIGRFPIVRVLGAGGMGFVYVGRDEQLRRDIAIKVLRSERDSPRARQRLEREALALAQLSHPNVVPVFEVGEHDGKLFIAMELVEGDSLRTWLRNDERPWREIVGVFVQAARGLAAAHARGLVHRDFKPENALIGDPNGRVRVVDFGVVADSDAQTTSDATVPFDDSDDVLRTRTGEFLGTPRYMAPEQFAGVRVGPQADQFAWCVALYEALSHDRPFIGATISELATAVSETAPAPLPFGPYPRALGPVLLRGLAREPGDRYASMDDLIAAVEAVMARRGAALPWIFGVAGLAIAGTAIAIYVAHRDDVPAPTVASEPTTPPVLLEGPPSDLQKRAQEPFAAGHAALERGDPDAAARSFDAAAMPFERAQADGEDIARIQLDRGLAHLALWQHGRGQDDLAIAHELLLRTKDNEYRHPHPEPLRARAEQALGEIAGAGLDAERRFQLQYVDEHPPDTLVETPERTICRTPCTLALPVDEATLMRFSHPGFTDSLMMTRPIHHLAPTPLVQPLRRLHDGDTYTPLPFPPI